mmetsp:Transcript_44659/g.145104  ORF Transcript_44659/g.145104 Transcript_44659/m.145104 type:complete len:98 (+) Transcript_44659:460-753(+)
MVERSGAVARTQELATEQAQVAVDALGSPLEMPHTDARSCTHCTHCARTRCLRALRATVFAPSRGCRDAAGLLPPSDTRDALRVLCHKVLTGASIKP